MTYVTAKSRTTTLRSIKAISITAFVSNALEISKQRRALARLSPSQLNDIGITPEQQSKECNLRFGQRG
jgi:uncharacterized protein YjiS (DUF1127 family)